MEPEALTLKEYQTLLNLLQRFAKQYPDHPSIETCVDPTMRVVAQAMHPVLLDDMSKAGIDV